MNMEQRRKPLFSLGKLAPAICKKPNENSHLAAKGARPAEKVNEFKHLRPFPNAAD
jgi:hypothetical protein